MAMTSTIHRLKMFKKTPENGLAIFCGLVTTSSISMTSSAKDGAMKKMCVVMEPIVPLNRGLYYCDARFHVEDLMAQVDQHESSMTYGFVIVNGSGMLLGLLKGTSHQVLYEKGVQLPKKHSKGGQSRERFARLRDQAIDHYLKLTAEKCNEYFISKNKENLLVDGIILAGSANLKNVFSSEATKLMDYRLSSKILNVIDIQYGGMSGFMQAIDKSKALFSELRYTKEQELLNTFMNLIAIDSMKYTFGLKHTLCALEMGLVDKLILYEDLKIHRCVVGEDVAQSVQYLTPDKMTMLTEPLVHSQLLIEWLLEEDKAIMQFGCSSIELVSASSNEGQQFVKGFGAIGAILKYETNIEEMMLSSNDTHAEHFFDDDEETDDTDLDGFL